MISNMKETKYFFENMFLTNWSDTPVHFVGQEFTAKGLTSWINPRFVPSGGRLGGLSGLRSRLEAELDVVCWAKNDVEAFDLADKIVSFVHANANDFNINGYEVNDHGWNENNMVYVILTFSFTYYAGMCTLPKVPCIIVNNGVPIVHGGVTVTNIHGGCSGILPPTTRRTVVNHGIPVTNHGIILTN